MRKYAAVLTLVLLSVAVTVPLMDADAGSADDTTGVSSEFRVKNVYSVEFRSLGVIPDYDQGSAYYFVKGSDNYNVFQQYLENGENMPISDDRPTIMEGDVIVSYMLSSEFYDDGYTTIVEFYNFGQTMLVGYLQLTYDLEISMTVIDHFFVKGSIAVIRWSTSPSNMTVYFGGNNISKDAEYTDGYYEAKVDIDRNGSYSLWFANDVNGALTAQVSHSVSSYETSGSLWIAVIAFLLATIGILIVLSVYPKPAWASEKVGHKGE